VPAALFEPAPVLSGNIQRPLAPVFEPEVFNAANKQKTGLGREPA